MNVGIIGASGYSGELLVRLLLRHPRVTVTRVTSRQHAGKPLAEVIPELRGRDSSLAFVDSDPAVLAADSGADLWFLALPHGVAASFAEPLVKAGKKVIDLSADFRLDSPETYRRYYGGEHPSPDLLARSVYVLPELNPLQDWKEAPLAAAPGCYPTSVLIPLIPLLADRVLSGRGMSITSFSGVSGAGRKVAEDFLFCERAESAKAYGIPHHRHLSEIEERLGAAAGSEVVVQFVPHLAPMRRGIATTIVTPAAGVSLEALYASWKKAFEGRPFVHLLPPGQTPETRSVTGTNRIDLSAVYDERTDNFVILSAEDNLMKGAGGQAVQIMNLWLGYDETDGLLA